MKLTREMEADIVCGVEGFPWIEGVYAFASTAETNRKPDEFAFAIILASYAISELVQTHYAVLRATGAHEIAGRVLYVNAAMPWPTPLRRARRLVVDAPQREAALRRIAKREAQAATTERHEAELMRLRDLEWAFHRLAEQASRDKSSATPRGGHAPYRVGKPLNEYTQAELQRAVDRAFDGVAISAPLAAGVLEIVSDPFPQAPRKRILVADDDPATEQAMAALDEYEVVLARDGWTAIDFLTEGDFELALCAVVLGGMPAAKIFRVMAKARPQMASRFVFIAKESVVAQAPVSANGKVLARPIDVAAVRALLKAVSAESGAATPPD